MRKINCYIVEMRKRTNLRKEFSSNVLSKILLVADGKNRSKLDIKQVEAITVLAKSTSNSTQKSVTVWSESPITKGAMSKIQTCSTAKPRKRSLRTFLSSIGTAEGRKLNEKF